MCWFTTSFTYESGHRAIRYTERLAEAEAVASVGSKGDSYDCQALATRSRKDRVVLAATV